MNLCRKKKWEKKNSKSLNTQMRLLQRDPIKLVFYHIDLRQLGEVTEKKQEDILPLTRLKISLFPPRLV